MNELNNSSGDVSPPEREVILATLGDTIEDVHAQLEVGAADDLEAERMQIRWTRTLGYLVGQYRKLQAETDIDELQADVELLEVATGLEEDR